MDRRNEGIDHACGGLHEISYHETDYAAAKQSFSALDTGDMNDIIECLGITDVFAAGFSAAKCVPETVQSLVKKGVKVSVFEDCTGVSCSQDFHFYAEQNTECLNKMAQMGISIIPSNIILEELVAA